MQWSHVPPPPGYEWLEGSLRKEYDRLTKAIEIVEKKRVDADVLDPLEADLIQDHSDLIRARIVATEAEIGLRESLTIFYLACERAANEKRAQAKADLQEVALSARERLGIPDRIQVPDAVLQNTAEWWTARERLNAVPCNDSSGARMEHDRAIRAARGQLEKLKSALAYEPARVARAARLAQQEVDFTSGIVEADEERRRVPDEREERVASLLV